MDQNPRGAYADRDLPLGCWHQVFNFLEPPSIARAAAVNRTCRTASYDSRLWYPHFKKAWSPEQCGSLQTSQDDKDFCSLYARWQTGQPAAVDLIPGVHGPEVPASAAEGSFRQVINAVQLSQAGAHTAWSVGQDEALVVTDMTTCQCRNRFLPPHTGYGLFALTVLDSIGLVCTGGKYLTGWDPRQWSNKPTSTFCVEYSEATNEFWVSTMISAASPECDGPPQVLTGGPCEGSNSMVCLWDLRFIDAGPVRQYAASTDMIKCLALEPRHSTLLGGGWRGITCWDRETGAQLSTLWTDKRLTFDSLAVGRDRLVSGGYPGNVFEWAIPDPRAIVEEPEPQRVRTLANMDNHRIVTSSMQGVGEGPERILAGTNYGSICMWDCLGGPEQLPICWSLGDHTCPGAAVSCLADTDQLVVNGFNDGALRIMRVDTHSGKHGS